MVLSNVDAIVLTVLLRFVGFIGEILFVLFVELILDNSSFSVVLIVVFVIESKSILNVFNVV